MWAVEKGGKSKELARYAWDVCGWVVGLRMGHVSGESTRGSA